MRIGLFIFPKLTQLDATGPYEVFARIPGATVELIAASAEPVVTEWGMTVMPTATIGNVAQLDVVCVPGGAGINALLEDSAVLDFLAQQAARAEYVTSVCTGSLVLGAAGLLTGYRATTHWLSLDLLPIFGAIPVNDRIVFDRNRITGGGITAGIDFGLAVAPRPRPALPWWRSSEPNAVAFRPSGDAWPSAPPCDWAASASVLSP